LRDSRNRGGRAEQIPHIKQRFARLRGVGGKRERKREKGLLKERHSLSQFTGFTEAVSSWRFVSGGLDSLSLPLTLTCLLSFTWPSSALWAI